MSSCLYPPSRTYSIHSLTTHRRNLSKNNRELLLVMREGPKSVCNYLVLTTKIQLLLVFHDAKLDCTTRWPPTTYFHQASRS